MDPQHDPSTHDPPAQRPPYRHPVGLPLRDQGWRTGAAVSILVHALVIGLLIIPFFLPSNAIRRMQQGAGGAGAAGGGGGGRRGSGERVTESIRFVRVGTTPVPTPTTLPPVPPPVQPPVVPPTRPPIVPPKAAPEPRPEPAAVPKPQSAAPEQPLTVASAATGEGAGSGTDGSSGAGPGSGGGVGSGVGTGKGSAVGPGTGGGTQINYPPQPIEFFLPPLPPPSSVRGLRFVAEFDVDSTGRVLGFDFTRTRDGDYNKRISDVLRAMRFRPGTGPDGSPTRMKAQVGYEF